MTLESFAKDNVRLLYVAAQTANIETKTTTAIHEVMKTYRRVVGTATGLNIVPGAPTTNRTAAAYKICKVILRCFGLPTMKAETVLKIFTAQVLDDLGHNLSIALAEGIAIVGLGATIVDFGLPCFLGSAFNIAIAVPATTHVMLMLMADIILILTRAFKETTFTCVGMPEQSDVSRSACRFSA